MRDRRVARADRVTRARRWAATATIAATLAAGCGASTGVGLSGVFGGDAAAGCTWLDTAVDRRVLISWGAGYRPAFDPVRLLGPDGSVMAREGDTVGLGGGEYARPVAGLDPVCGDARPFRSGGSVDVTPGPPDTATATATAT